MPSPAHDKGRCHPQEMSPHDVRGAGVVCLDRNSGESVAGMTNHTFVEFFAGGGMARAGLGDSWRCLFANDFDQKKVSTYEANWGVGDIKHGDVASLTLADLPTAAVDLAWASFPCQDLSLAGGYGGLGRERDNAPTRSGAFWPFWRLMRGLVQADRAPRTIPSGKCAWLFDVPRRRGFYRNRLRSLGCRLQIRGCGHQCLSFRSAITAPRLLHCGPPDRNDPGFPRRQRTRAGLASRRADQGSCWHDPQDEDKLGLVGDRKARFANGCVFRHPRGPAYRREMAHGGPHAVPVGINVAAASSKGGARDELGSANSRLGLPAYAPG